MFRRRANDIAAIFRLAGGYTLYAFPAFYVLDLFYRQHLPRLVPYVLALFVAWATLLIGIRRVINGATERRVESALRRRGDESGRAASEEKTVRQSFDLRGYRRLNAAVMFSFLRIYPSIVTGVAALIALVWSLVVGRPPLVVALLLILVLYQLLLPWVLFAVKTNRVYRTRTEFLEKQEIRFGNGFIDVGAGGHTNRVESLSDIAVMPGYLLLFTIKTNYLQVDRRGLTTDDTDLILVRAAAMVR